MPKRVGRMLYEQSLPNVNRWSRAVRFSLKLENALESAIIAARPYGYSGNADPVRGQIRRGNLRARAINDGGQWRLTELTLVRTMPDEHIDLWERCRSETAPI